MYTGVHRDTPVALDARFYNEENATNLELDHGKTQLPESSDEGVLWIDLRGVHETELLQKMGQQYRIHPLALEDIADTHQRAKFDEYPTGIILIFPSLHWADGPGEVQEEQISVYFTDSFVFSFQERPDDLYTEVKQRIEEGRGRVRSRKADYLAYVLMDHAVDSYFHILDKFQEETEKLEEQINTSDTSGLRQRIHYLKYEYLTIRKGLLPMREMAGKLSRADHPFIGEDTKLYFRDLYDHILQIIEQMEIQREVLYGIQELHLSEISFQMNRVMKVLTVITTIFVPLSFLTGLYGMNFDDMPELHYPYAYPILWAIMLLIVAGSLYYFRRKDWL